LVVILILQFIAAFVYLWRVNRGLFLQDIRVFFLLSFALYTLFWPIAKSIIGLSLDENAFNQTVIAYNLAILGYNLVLFFNNKKWDPDVAIMDERYKVGYNIGIAFLSFLVMYSIYYMYSKGIPIFAFSSFNVDRLEYFESVSQLWVVLKFIVAGVSTFLLFQFRNLSRLQKIILLSIIGLYILYQISLGNRNEYVLIVLFAVGFVLSYRKKAISIKGILVLLVLFAFSFYITIMRNAEAQGNTTDENIQLVMQSNEFMYPVQTTYYTIKDDWPLRYGETYVILPLKIIIPRSLQTDKPMSLGSEFVVKTFGAGWSGYAYTPVTEAYLNFGLFGPFIIYVIIGLILNSFVEDVCKNGITYKYLVAYSVIFNFCRGDVASTIYMLLFLWLTYLVMKMLIQKKKIKVTVN